MSPIFVEEKRAAITLLELADALSIGAGEGALLVAEQLAFQQRFGNGGAIDGEKMPMRAFAVMVNSASHQFLARAALAQNQHRDILRRDAANALVHLLHRGTTANELIRTIPGDRARVGHRRRDTHELADIEGSCDDFAQTRRIERLEHIFISAQTHGIDRRLGLAVTRHENDRHARIDVVEPPECLKAGQIRQANIKDDHVGHLLAKSRQVLLRGPRRAYVHLSLRKKVLEAIKRQRVIVDYQQIGHCVLRW